MSNHQTKPNLLKAEGPILVT